MPENPKTPAGQTVIKVNHQRLQIVLNYRGVRKYLSLGLPDSKLNRVYAEMVRDYLNLKTTPNTTKRVLTQLGACCKWALTLPPLGEVSHTLTLT
ncbi:Arm DNA-binding domain-containing protein [Chamaesiphon sp.]|uniref:Arm DNA-binding domain-containing protein n=1 Tax=Chamaesiphon sp. TaxID=2814140 RepID=UPI0035942625